MADENGILVEFTPPLKQMAAVSLNPAYLYPVIRGPKPHNPSFQEIF